MSITLEDKTEEHTDAPEVEMAACTSCGEVEDGVDGGVCQECLENGAVYCTICDEWTIPGYGALCAHLFHFDGNTGCYWGTGSDYMSYEDHKEHFFSLIANAPGLAGALARTLRLGKSPDVYLSGSLFGYDTINCWLPKENGEWFGNWGELLFKCFESEVYLGHLETWWYGGTWRTEYNVSFSVISEDETEGYHRGLAWLIGLRETATKQLALTLSWLENDYPSWNAARYACGEGI